MEIPELSNFINIYQSSFNKESSLYGKNLELELRFGKFYNKKFNPGVSKDIYNRILKIHDKYKKEKVEQSEYIISDGDINKKIKIISAKDKKDVINIKSLMNRNIDIHEFDLRFSLSEEVTIDENDERYQELILKKKESVLKRYKYRTHIYITDYIILDMSEITYIDNITNEIKNIIYEVELEFFSDKVVYENIIHVINEFLKVYQNTLFVISNKEYKHIYTQYCNLTKSNYFCATNCIPLSTKIINSKIFKEEKFAVSPKIDGERNFLMIYQDSLYLINKHLQIKKIYKNSQLVQFSDTIFDGELTDIFYIFDIFVYKGLDIKNDNLYNLSERIKLIKEIFPYIQNIVKIKEYIINTENIFTNIINVCNDKHDFKIDGVILTPLFKPYKNPNVYKYKHVENTTIDFFVSKTIQNKKITWILKSYDGNKHVPFEYNKNKKKYCILENISTDINEEFEAEIVEFAFKDNSFYPIKNRFDKSNANFIDIAIDNMDNIMNPLTMDKIYDYSKINNNNIYIPSYLETILKSEKHINDSFNHMRKFNNIVKRYLFDKYCNNIDLLISFGIGQGGDIVKWNANNITKIIGYDISNENLKELQTRINYYKNNNILYYKKDLSIDSILYKDQADCIDSMFSFHYFLKDQKSFDTFMKNICNNLKDNGYFIGVCFDGSEIHSIPGKTYKFLNLDNDILFNIEKKYDYKQKYEDLDLFGNNISVYLNNDSTIISDKKISHEYLVNFDKLIEIMEKTYNLKLVELCSIKKFYKQLMKICPLDKYENAFTFMNKIFVFQKIPSTDNKVISISEALLFQYNNKFKETKLDSDILNNIIEQYNKKQLKLAYKWFPCKKVPEYSYCKCGQTCSKECYKIFLYNNKFIKNLSDNIEDTLLEKQINIITLYLSQSGKQISKTKPLFKIDKKFKNLLAINKDEHYLFIRDKNNNILFTENIVNEFINTFNKKEKKKKVEDEVIIDQEVVVEEEKIVVKIQEAEKLIDNKNIKKFTIIELKLKLKELKLKLTGNKLELFNRLYDAIN